jgi:hypothetical protein
LTISSPSHRLAEEPSPHERRQAIVDALLIKANKTAQAGRRVATMLVSALF